MGQRGIYRSPLLAFEVRRRGRYQEGLSSFPGETSLHSELRAVKSRVNTLNSRLRKYPGGLLRHVTVNVGPLDDGSGEAYGVGR